MQNSLTAENGFLRRAPVTLKHLLGYLSLFVLYCAILYLYNRLSGKSSGWAGYYLLYMSFPNTFIPLPTNPVIIGLGRTYSPLFIGFLGAIGTTVANVNEYHLIGYFSSRRFADRIKRKKLYRSFDEWYWKNPFLFLALTNFLPIPVDPVRWFSISSGYNRSSYVAATFTGRAPRYYLLALLGEKFQPSNTILLVILIIPAAYVGTRYLIKKIKRGEPNAADQ